MRESIEVKQSILKDNRLVELVQEAARACVRALDCGGKLILCGNGGSAADAQHLAAELTGRYLRERRALQAIALTTNTSCLTTIGNDYSYDEVFSRQIEAIRSKADIAIGISTSGNVYSLGTDPAHPRGAHPVGAYSVRDYRREFCK